MIPTGLVRRNFAVCSTKFDVLEACPAARVLQGAREKPSKAQWHGIYTHQFIETATEQGKDKALARIHKASSAVQRCCSGIDVDRLPKGIVEIGWAHDPFANTVRQLHAGPATAQVHVMTEQFGRADLASFTPADRERFDGESRPLVTDFKTGTYMLGATPRESSQLMGLGTCLQILTNAAEVDIAIANIAHDGRIDWSIDTLTQDDTNAYRLRAQRVHLQVLATRSAMDAGQLPEFVPNPECRWCSCRKACPAACPP